MNDGETNRTLGFLISDLARLLRLNFDRRIASLGLTRSQWWVLSHLSRGDGLTQTELADILELGRVTVGGLLDRLEQKGWIRRRPDPVDRRVKRVFLEPKADAVVAEIHRLADQFMDEVLCDLSMAGREKLAHTLGQMKANLLPSGGTRTDA